jgi:hypothetical protein
MKRIAQTTCLAAVLIALSACSSSDVSVSGGDQTPQTAITGLTDGNWYISSTSSQNDMINFYSGPLSVSSNKISLATAQGSLCFPGMSLVFSGTVSGNNVTITSPSLPGNNKVITMTGTSHYGSNFDGVYQITGAAASDQCYGDSGTVFGIRVTPLDGSWSGILTESAYDQYGNVVVDMYGAPVKNTAYAYATISQAASPKTINTVAVGTVSAYPLSGNMTFRNSPCYGSGTIDDSKSYIVGSSYSLVVNTDTGGTLVSSGSMDPTRPISMNFIYSVPSGPCKYYQVAGTLQTPAIDYGLLP